MTLSWDGFREYSLLRASCGGLVTVLLMCSQSYSQVSLAHHTLYTCYSPQSTVCRGGRGSGPVYPVPAETCGSILPDVPSPAQCCEKERCNVCTRQQGKSSLLRTGVQELC